jgi:plastocyanin
MKTTWIAALAVGGTLIGGAGTALTNIDRTHAAPAHAAISKTMKIVEQNNKYMFAKAKMTVKVGTKVTWLNATDAPHTVTGTGGWTFASKTFTQNAKVSHVFNKAGTYQYMCAIHPYMKATIVVK